MPLVSLVWFGLVWSLVSLCNWKSGSAKRRKGKLKIPGTHVVEVLNITIYITRSSGMRFLEVERLVSELINGQLEEMMNGRSRPQETKTIPPSQFHNNNISIERLEYRWITWGSHCNSRTIEGSLLAPWKKESQENITKIKYWAGSEGGHQSEFSLLNYIRQVTFSSIATDKGYGKEGHKAKPQ